MLRKENGRKKKWARGGANTAAEKASKIFNAFNMKANTERCNASLPLHEEK